MKFQRLVASTAVGLGAIALTSAAWAAEARYIILMKGNSVPHTLEGDIAAKGGQLVRVLPQVGIAIATSTDPGFATRASALTGVSLVGPVAANSLPTPSMEVEAAHSPTAADDLFNGGLVWGVQRVGAPAAWARGHTGQGAVVAIIDTGIAWNHPDLAPNVIGAECVTSQPTCNPYPTLSDHGTHVAGTVAAAFGGGRVVGVAPQASLYSYNTFEFIPGCGTCSYSDSRWVAMLDAADLGHDVINMSLGGLGVYGGGRSNDLATFVAAEKRVANYVSQKGTVMVASAGNSNVDLNGPLINVPGGVQGIINVAATGIRQAPRFPQPGAFDVRAFYSNYGASVALAGPGGDCGLPNSCDPLTRPADWFEYLVFSTVVTLGTTGNPACAATASCPTGYGWKGGTSMAAPHVSGVAALAKKAHPGLNVPAIGALLKRSAEPLGNAQSFGAGMVRADRATD